MKLEKIREARISVGVLIIFIAMIVVGALSLPMMINH